MDLSELDTNVTRLWVVQQDTETAPVGDPVALPFGHEEQFEQD